MEHMNFKPDGKFSLFYYLGFFFLSTSKHNESKCMVM